MLKITRMPLFHFPLYWGALLALLSFTACSQKTSVKPQEGLWRAVLTSPGGELPFFLEIKSNPDQQTYQVTAINGAERLPMDSATLQGDTLRIPMGIFEAELVAQVTPQQLTGFWRKFRKGQPDLRMPLVAKPATPQVQRFKIENLPNVEISGKWRTTFQSPEGKSSQAVGVFKQQGNQLTGTFLTTTGDYRYLAGNVTGDSLFLSCYDGSHLFLFKAKVSGNQLTGGFWSGPNGYRGWTATRDDQAALPDLNTLTYLKPGAEGIRFDFPNLDGTRYQYPNPSLEGKVVIVQILGTWCPNCMDETNFLAPWYKYRRNKPVEIIGLAFEKSTDLAEAAPRIERMKKRFDVRYPVLLAGLNDAAAASAALPMLNKVMGFPTTIIIDKKGKVRRIHTGFSGPGTGVYYDEFVEEFNLLIEKLLEE
jgi:thiol-disulfide isomerase/thioredoxin